MKFFFEQFYEWLDFNGIYIYIFKPRCWECGTIGLNDDS